MTKNNKEGKSHLDELSSGYDAQGYDKEQEGKAHTEEVAKSNNWGNDKRDAIGRAAVKNQRTRIANRLKRIAMELEAMGYEEKMSEEYTAEIQDISEQIKKQPSGVGPGGQKATEMMEDEDDSMSMDGDFMNNEEEDGDDGEDMMMHATKAAKAKLKKADHPLTHDSARDNPEADRPYQYGDDEWVDIGPGSFNDSRDEVRRAK